MWVIIYMLLVGLKKLSTALVGSAFQQAKKKKKKKKERNYSLWVDCSSLCLPVR